MDQNPIATQPRNSDKPPGPPAEVPNTGHIEDSEKEKLTEVTAVFNPAGQCEDNLTEEEKQKRRERHEEVDCCCVNTYYTDDTDPFCLYILCNLICDCFRGIGHCTEGCFDCCANCLSGCCEGDGGCLECCNCEGADAANAVDGDCFTSCLGCCSD